MFTYQKFSIAATAHFIPLEFPLLQTSIQQVAAQLADQPGIKTEMLLSFVKDHSMNAKQVDQYPELASRISNQSLPLHLIEGLFAAAKNNPVFVKQLEAYIRSCFAATERNKNSDHSTLLS